MFVPCSSVVFYSSDPLYHTHMPYTFVDKIKKLEVLLEIIVK